MVIGFTENVNIVGRNNAIHHFDTCGFSIFLQVHFLHIDVFLPCARSLFPMLLFHEVCYSSNIYLLIDGLKLENGILKEVGSNESDVFCLLINHLIP